MEIHLGFRFIVCNNGALFCQCIFNLLNQRHRCSADPMFWENRLSIFTLKNLKDCLFHFDKSSRLAVSFTLIVVLNGKLSLAIVLRTRNCLFTGPPFDPRCSGIGFMISKHDRETQTYLSRCGQRHQSSPSTQELIADAST